MDRRTVHAVRHYSTARKDNLLQRAIQPPLTDAYTSVEFN
jgi:hypothetical protein